MKRSRVMNPGAAFTCRMVGIVKLRKKAKVLRKELEHLILCLLCIIEIL